MCLNTKYACAALLVAMSSAPVLAATSTGTMAISAQVLSACSLSGSSIPFGTYASTEIDQTGTMSVMCTNGVPYNVALDAGLGISATTSSRKMSDSLGGTLNYGLYRDAGHLNNWGNVTNTDTLTGSGNGTTQVMTVYGKIPAGQTPSVGTYTDTVTITLSY